ncbi:MAG: RNA-directed DNA polymerase [Alphaproteobacteria bacterium]|nr:RNA-directed DNA polymerase [Alphaproteobacteria bacterium]
MQDSLLQDEKTAPVKSDLETKIKTILDLSCAEARQFFVKGKSYCNFDLPDYFQFDHILSDLNKILAQNTLTSLRDQKPRDFDDVNYKILNNKDGRYAWRPMQLIHPALYISLVQKLTDESAWQYILNRFKEFKRNPRIECISLPIVSYTDKSDKAEQVLNWWLEVEQKSIELALDYECLIQTDITDCYGAIYTHSIAWALHDKEFIKKHENRSNKNLIGNSIDEHLQDMSHGQTNGIPHGSTLMDFVAEILLGYADMLLTQKIGAEISDYHIIRYRDDYRIFVNNPRDGEKIVKHLTEVMIGLNLKLSTEKTKKTDQVIQNSIKVDKQAWMKQKQSEQNLQKHLLIIHNFSTLFPNSGSLVAALQNYYDRVSKIKTYAENVIPLISIVVDIAHNNPRTYPLSAAILSVLFTFIPHENQKNVLINKVLQKFKKIPNTGHLEIWLQRITLGFKSTPLFDEPLCKVVKGEDVEIWNNSWLKQPLQKVISPARLINKNTLQTLPAIISKKEVALFQSQFNSDVM